MRVGYVLKRYPRYSETFVVNEILAHEEAGLEVEIFALRPPSDTHFQDSIARVRAPVRYIAAKPASASSFWQSLRDAQAEAPREVDFDALLACGVGELSQAMEVVKLARAAGVTHLHAHFATLATSVAQLASSLSDLSYSFTAHAKDIFHEDTKFDALQRRLRGASGVVTVSQYNIEYLDRLCPEASDRVHLVYNGMDLERFTYQERKGKEPRIIAVGRLVEKKGFDVLVDACAELRRRGVTFSCEIVGHGELEAELRERITSQKLDDLVALTGPRPQMEVIETVRNAAVMAAPCVVGADGNRDGLPTTIVESMALGTPVVSTDVTAIPELVRDGVTGREVGQNDVVGLADVLEELLGDRDQCLRLSRAARDLIDSEFDVRNNTRRIRDIFAAAGSKEA